MLKICHLLTKDTLTINLYDMYLRKKEEEKETWTLFTVTFI